MYNQMPAPMQMGLVPPQHLDQIVADVTIDPLLMNPQIRASMLNAIFGTINTRITNGNWFKVYAQILQSNNFFNEHIKFLYKHTFDFSSFELRSKFRGDLNMFFPNINQIVSRAVQQCAAVTVAAANDQNIRNYISTEMGGISQAYNDYNSFIQNTRRQQPMHMQMNNNQAIFNSSNQLINNNLQHNNVINTIGPTENFSSPGVQMNRAEHVDGAPRTSQPFGYQHHNGANQQFANKPTPAPVTTINTKQLDDIRVIANCVELDDTLYTNVLSISEFLESALFVAKNQLPEANTMVAYEQVYDKFIGYNTDVSILRERMLEGVERDGINGLMTELVYCSSRTKDVGFGNEVIINNIVGFLNGSTRDIIRLLDIDIRFDNFMEDYRDLEEYVKNKHYEKYNVYKEKLNTMFKIADSVLTKTLIQESFTQDEHSDETLEEMAKSVIYYTKPITMIVTAFDSMEIGIDSVSNHDTVAPKNLIKIIEKSKTTLNENNVHDVEKMLLKTSDNRLYYIKSKYSVNDLQSTVHLLSI